MVTISSPDDVLSLCASLSSFPYQLIKEEELADQPWEHPHGGAPLWGSTSLGEHLCGEHLWGERLCGGALSGQMDGFPQESPGVLLPSLLALESNTSIPLLWGSCECELYPHLSE